MKYTIKIQDESGATVASHTVSKDGFDMVVAAIHEAAVSGKSDRASVSAAVRGVVAKPVAANL